MEELCDILSHKLGLLAGGDAHSLAAQEREERLELLLVEKKKESLRILVETRLQMALNARAVMHPHELNEFRLRSYQLMAIADPTLPLPAAADPFSALAELYSLFFNRAGCGARSQEIQNMHRKRLCPKPLLAATLFNWLVEWTRKQFQDHLKHNIHSLYLSNKSSPRSPSLALDEQLPADSEPTLATLAIHSLPPAHRRSLRSSFCRALSPSHPRTLSPSKPHDFLKQRSVSPSQSVLGTLEGKMGTLEAEQGLPINKEIYFCSYSEELQRLYRSLEDCVGDLDFGFLRRWKKTARRAQVAHRVQEVAASLAKGMHHVQDDINRYRRHYYEALGYPKTKLLKKSPKQPKGEGIRTSQGSRSPSPDRTNTQRRQRLISSLVRADRYALLDAGDAESNLLPTHSRKLLAIQSPREWQAKSRTLDLSLDLGGEKQSKVLLIHAGKHSTDLETIHERAKGVRAQVSASKRLKQSLERRRGRRESGVELQAVGELRLPQIGRKR